MRIHRFLGDVQDILQLQGVLQDVVQLQDVLQDVLQLRNVQRQGLQDVLQLQDDYNCKSTRSTTPANLETNTNKLTTDHVPDPRRHFSQGNRMTHCMMTK